MDPLFDLSNKVALVTGGSRGLGYQMVRAFAARGADVIVASRKLDNCEAVAAEVSGNRGVAGSPSTARYASRRRSMTPAGVSPPLLTTATRASLTWRAPASPRS
jgi:NAD(P)-dependent dehydrogenase (short-subunit alcohol dehydrogenase family)